MHLAIKWKQKKKKIFYYELEISIMKPYFIYILLIVWTCFHIDIVVSMYHKYFYIVVSMHHKYFYSKRNTIKDHKVTM